MSGKVITAKLGDDVEMVSEKKEVAYKLVINCAWGKTMEVPFKLL